MRGRGAAGQGRTAGRKNQGVEIFPFEVPFSLPADTQRQREYLSNFFLPLPFPPHTAPILAPPLLYSLSYLFLFTHIVFTLFSSFFVSFFLFPCYTFTLPSPFSFFLTLFIFFCPFFPFFLLFHPVVFSPFFLTLPLLPFHLTPLPSSNIIQPTKREEQEGNLSEAPRHSVLPPGNQMYCL